MPPLLPAAVAAAFLVMRTRTRPGLLLCPCEVERWEGGEMGGWTGKAAGRVGAGSGVCIHECIVCLRRLVPAEVLHLAEQAVELRRLCHARDLQRLVRPEARSLCRQHLWCHGTRYARHTRGWYAYGVRAVVQQLPVPQVRTLRRRPVRVACTYSTEAPGRTGQHSSAPSFRLPK